MAFPYPVRLSDPHVEVNALRDENTRLVKALRDIRDATSVPVTDPPPPVPDARCEACLRVGDLARAALEA